MQTTFTQKHDGNTRVSPSNTSILVRYPALSYRQQATYEEILPKLAARASSIDVSSTDSPDDVFKAYAAIVQDHPELFWLGSEPSISRITDGFSTSITLSVSSAIDARQIARAERAIDSELRAFVRFLPRNATSYDKVRSAYEYVIRRTSYDRSAPNGQNLLGVFLDRRSVCAGYAEAFCYLLRMTGIPCGCVTGVAGGRGSHEWNVARIDGVTTLIDPTWGDPVYMSGDGSRLPEGISYRYLCVTDEELGRTHSPDEGQAVPSCDSLRYDWYLRKNLLLSTFSVSEINSLLCRAAARGDHSLEVKYSSLYDYKRAVDYVDSQDVFSGRFGDMLRASARRTGRISISHEFDDDMRIVQVRW